MEIRQSFEKWALDLSPEGSIQKSVNDMLINFYIIIPLGNAAELWRVVENETTHL